MSIETSIEARPSTITRPPSNRYGILGLHRNPFGELDRWEAAEAAVVNIESCVEAIFASLDHPATRERSDREFAGRPLAFQWTGRCGRGKTTHLRAIQSRLADASYTYIPRRGRQVPIADAAVVMIDEAQRLPSAALVAVLASRRPLVLATHRRLDRSLAAAGYRVMHRRLGHRHEPIDVDKILRRRIEMATMDGVTPPPTRSVIGNCDHLQRRFGSNLRQLIHAAHERVERRCGLR